MEENNANPLPKLRQRKNFYFRSFPSPRENPSNVENCLFSVPHALSSLGVIESGKVVGGETDLGLF